MCPPKPSVHHGFTSWTVFRCGRPSLCMSCAMISVKLPLGLFTLPNPFMNKSLPVHPPSAHLQVLEPQLCPLSVQPPPQAEKQRLEGALDAAQEEEGSLAAAKRALEVRLDEAQRALARSAQEQQALRRALEEEGQQREALRQAKAELEEQKRLLDRTVDRLNKEVGRGAAWALGGGPARRKLTPRGRVVMGQNVRCSPPSSSLSGRPRSGLQRAASFLPALGVFALPPTHILVLYGFSPWRLPPPGIRLKRKNLHGENFIFGGGKGDRKKRK